MPGQHLKYLLVLKYAVRFIICVSLSGMCAGGALLICFAANR